MADQEKEAVVDPAPLLSVPENQLPLAEDKRPPLLLYSLLVPVLWISLGGLLQWLSPTVRLGTFGLFVILYAAVWITCWHFTKKFSRHFHRRERITLIVLTTAWAALAESLAIWTHIEDRALAGAPSLSDNALLGVLAFTLAFDAFMMWAAYTFLAKKFISRLLGQGAAAGA